MATTKLISLKFMLKQISLRIVKIKYSGKSVGDDVRLELSCLDKFLVLDQKIKKGEEKVINGEIGKFYSEQSRQDFQINIKIVEKDLVFNHFGDTLAKLKVDLNSPGSQITSYEVVVRERRGLKIGRSEGVFSVTVEALAEPAILYIPETEDGWLLVKDKNSVEKSLPSHLRVRHDRIFFGREYVTVLEGVLQGDEFSIALENGRSRLSRINSHVSVINLRYSISKKTLKLKNKTYKATDDPNKPWAPGRYDIEIPDHAHQLGLKYVADSKNAITWFRVGHGGKKYLHTGAVSEGCITIIETKKWDEIYRHLIKSRRGDGQSVGTIEIVK